jgi:hypothetical protein
MPVLARHTVGALHRSRGWGWRIAPAWAATAVILVEPDSLVLQTCLSSAACGISGCTLAMWR